MKKQSVFDLYRYQLLPKHRHMQTSLIHDYTTIEEVIAAKNKIFHEVFTHIRDFSTPKTAIIHKILYQTPEMMIAKFAANRQIKIETRNFTQAEVENWPSAYVIIWNHPDKQIMAIQHKWKAFSSTQALARVITDTMNNYLHKYNLVMVFEALREENSFWEIVEAHREDIQQVKFEIITPNLAEIYKSLNKDLLNLAQDTNSLKTELQLSTGADSHLEISQDNETINALVETAIQGGGNISIKLKGLKKRKYLKNKQKQIEIDELEINNLTEAQLTALFNKLLDD